MSKSLNPDKALIFRIVHRDNLGWILDHGLHCRASATQDPNYVSIGNAELIANRSRRNVPVPPGGTLSDYTPFYFTPYSPMMYNIKTGRGGVPRRAREDLVILTSSLHELSKRHLPFLFTDRHAYLQAAQFFSSLTDLSQIDWGILQRRDFKHDPEDPGKFERYQAEALVHRHVPISALLGISCYNQTVATSVGALIAERGLTLQVLTKPTWYF